MNADAFRQYFEYHFTENRKIWDLYVASLSQEQFTRAVDYSYGSVRDQIVHLMSADEYWFSGLRGIPRPEPFDPADFRGNVGALRPPDIHVAHVLLCVREGFPDRFHRSFGSILRPDAD